MVRDYLLENKYAGETNIPMERMKYPHVELCDVMYHY